MQITGKRPIISGMIPNFIKSSGRTLWIKSLNTGLSFLVLTFAPKPIPLLSVFKRLAMISSMPTNAPPTMNNILVVSTLIVGASGCLRCP